MTNSYYNHGSYPITGAPGASAALRAELDLVTAGFALLPTLSGNANKALVINAGGSAVTVTTGTLALAGNFATTGAFNTTLVQGATTSLTLPVVSGTLATLAGTETLSNKTIAASTLSGTVSGGGNQINNVIIGTSTPLAGTFTTLTSTSALITTDTTDATSITTGALQSAGGLGVTKAIWVGGLANIAGAVTATAGISSTLTTDATSATTGSIVTAGGLSAQKALWVGTTSRLVGAVTADAGVSSTLTTDATSATTGSIVTAGGISTQKALWVGTTSRLVGAVTANAGVSSTLVTDATSATTGSIVTAGGISTQKALWVGTTSRLVGAVTADAGISSTLVTDATSATTGSIVTAGGISAQKALWVGTTSRLVGAVTADAGISSTLTTDATSATTGSIVTAGGISTQKALWVGTTTTTNALTTTTGTISTTPSGSTDIANKLYVDTVAQGLDAKASCIAATTANITLSGTQTVDGVVLIATDRVLVKNQTASAENGLYLCAAGAWTRTTDADTWDELRSAFVFIEKGTTYADTGWVCTIDSGGTLGTTAVTWAQFSGAGSYTAGTGLTLTGTAFSLTAPVTVALGGTNATSAGITSFNNITGYTASGATGTTSTNLVFSASPTLTGTLTAAAGAFSSTLTSAAHTVTSASATALAVGLNGATNPAFTVDSSTGSQVAGLKVTGAVTGGTVAVVATDSGSATNLTVNAKGTGTIGIGSVSTGAVTITPATTLSAALTYGGVTLSNAVTGTGNMVLSASPTFTGTVAVAAVTATSLALGGATLGTNALAVTGTTLLNSALNYGGVTLSNAVTGTGNMVLSASPTLTGILTAATGNFSGNVSAPNYYSAAAAFRVGYLSSYAFMDVYGSAGDILTFGITGAEKMRLNSSGLGIGMTPSNVLDITQNQASNSYGNLLNSTSTGAAYWRTTNGTYESRFGIIGTAGAFGAFANSDTVIYGSSAISIATAGAIKFDPGNGGEAARFDTSGRLQLSNALIYGGVTLSNAVTGTGNMVLSASPTFTGTIIAAGATFSSPVTINDSTEVQLTMGGSNGSQGRLRTAWDGTGAAGRVTLSAKNIAGTLTDVFRINGEGVSSTCLGPLTINNSGGAFPGNIILTANYGNGSTQYIDASVPGGAGLLGFKTGGTERAVIDAYGNLGIGMTPSNILDITQNQNGQSTASIKNPSTGSSASAALQAQNDAGYTAVLAMTSSTTASWQGANAAVVYSGSALGGLTLATGAAKPIYFKINVTEYARFGTDGSFLVGGTTNGGVLGNAKFAVSGAASFFSGTLSGYGAATYTFSSDNSNDANCVEIMQGRYNKAALTISGNNTGTITAVQFYDQGVGVGTITTTSSATAYNTSSDARLKTNVFDAAPASALIDAIQVRQFDWKVDSSHQRYGMVAQELLEVAPEAVSVPTDPEEMMGVDYSKLVPMLIKEVQSLRTRLAALENK
jgi:hypothetical protein